MGTVLTPDNFVPLPVKKNDIDGGELLQALPAAVYTTDAAGRITFYNEAAAALWGCCPELGKSEWCGSWRLYWPDGRSMPHDQCPMAIALKEKRPIRGAEALAERPDGTRIPFLAYPTPLRDHTGRLIGAVNTLVDITERKKAECTAQRFSAIVESSDDAILSKDLNGIITTGIPVPSASSAILPKNLLASRSLSSFQKSAATRRAQSLSVSAGASTLSIMKLFASAKMAVWSRFR